MWQYFKYLSIVLGIIGLLWHIENNGRVYEDNLIVYPLSTASVYIHSLLVNRHRGEHIYMLILVFISYRMLTRQQAFEEAPTNPY